jgi:hypothetical protein
MKKACWRLYVRCPSLQTNSQSDGIGHALHQGNTISTILLQGQTNPLHLRRTASEILPRLALSQVLQVMHACPTDFRLRFGGVLW